MSLLPDEWRAFFEDQEPRIVRGYGGNPPREIRFHACGPPGETLTQGRHVVTRVEPATRTVWYRDADQALPPLVDEALRAELSQRLDILTAQLLSDAFGVPPEEVAFGTETGRWTLPDEYVLGGDYTALEQRIMAEVAAADHEPQPLYADPSGPEYCSAPAPSDDPEDRGYVPTWASPEG